MPRHVAGPEGGGNGRGRAAGDWVGATEERRTLAAAVFGASHPALWDGRSPSAMMLSKARVGAVRRAACAEPICGGTLPSTAAAEATEELGAGVAGARAAPARPRGLAGEGGVCVSELGGARRPRPGRSLRGRRQDLKRTSSRHPLQSDTGGRAAFRRMAREGEKKAARTSPAPRAFAAASTMCLGAEPGRRRATWEACAAPEDRTASSELLAEGQP
jgi:hypothetical protein